MNKQNITEIVSFQKEEIIGKVKSHGDVTDISTWETAFPEIGFSKIELKKLSPTELAAYVAYIVNPQAAILTYAINHDEVGDIMGVKTQGTDIWDALLAQVFTYFDNKNDIPNDALLELFRHAAIKYWQDRQRLPDDKLDYEDAAEFTDQTRADYLLLRFLSFRHQRVV